MSLSSSDLDRRHRADRPEAWETPVWLLTDSPDSAVTADAAPTRAPRPAERQWRTIPRITPEPSRITVPADEPLERADDGSHYGRHRGPESARTEPSGPTPTAVPSRLLADRFEQLRATAGRSVAAMSRADFWSRRVWVLVAIGALLGLVGLFVGLLGSASQPAQAPIQVTGSPSLPPAAPLPALSSPAPSPSVVAPKADAVAPDTTVRQDRPALEAKPEAETEPEPEVKPRTVERRTQRSDTTPSRGRQDSRDYDREREMAENFLGSLGSGGFRSSN